MMKNKKVLVLGNGFLGKTFKRLESFFGGVDVYGRKEFEVDIENVEGSVENLYMDDYDVVVNCIGMANTRFCEDKKNWDTVFAINGELPKYLSRRCDKLGKQFVHISSGCVYDKNNTPQTEESPLASHCKYVVSKLAGEFGCSENTLILRPRLFFGSIHDKGNLFDKMDNFKEFLTEMNSFTSVETVAISASHLIKNNCKGVFNVADEGYTNMSEIAKIWYGDDRYKNTLSASSLCESQGLVLVNNILNIDKLKQYYQPPNVIDDILHCKDSLM